MGVKDVALVFDHIPSGGFESGTTVSGRVKIITDKPTDMKYINLLLQGKAKVRFRERRVHWFKGKHPSYKILEFGEIINVDWNAISLRRSLSDSTYFTSQQMFVDQIVSLADETNLMLGITEYPFCFKIPEDSPSTFCGDRGHIRHKIKVKWGQKGFLSPSDTYKVELRVENPTTFQLLQFKKPAYFVPRSYESTKSFKVVFSSSHRVTTTISLPRSAFITGETVRVGINVQNDSTIKVKAVAVKLIERCSWIGKHASLKTVKVDDTLLQEFNYDGIPPSENMAFSLPLNLNVAPTPYIDSCVFIKLCHFIKVEVVPTGMYSKLNWLAPLKIFPVSDKKIIKEDLFVSTDEPSTSGFGQPDSDEPPPPYQAPPPYSQIYNKP